MPVLRLCLGERNVRNLFLKNVMVVYNPPDHAIEANFGPFRVGNEYLFLGEIKNMPGHGVFVDSKTGETLYGYHLDNFYLLMEGITVESTSIVDGNEVVEVQYTVMEERSREVEEDES